jgi:protein involved in polysaccharide export with SLBB domain/capsular polysaccharide biosynthesis protein
MSEPEKFSVSAVQKKREQSAAPETAPAAVTAAFSAAPVEKLESETAVSEKSLPFDPLRLVAAVWRRWRRLPLAGLALMLLAGVLGFFKFQTSYTANVQLIRHEVSTTLRASQLGDAFKPRQVTVGTVVSVMQSDKLLASVGAKANPPMTGDALLARLTIKPERDTDLIDVTLKVPGSEKATADLINNYANAVVALTAQMQADEAVELDRFLREQISRADAELEQVNKELLEFSRTSEFYGAEREMEAYLRELGDAEMQLQGAKTDLQTVDFRITSVERELAQQNPLAHEVMLARQQLESLRTGYTDENPVVKDAKDRLAALEKQLATAIASTNSVGTDYQFSENTVANNLYMLHVNLRGDRENLVHRIAQLTEYRDGVQKKLGGIPEKSMKQAQIAARQQTLQATRDLLAGRQHEAQIYEQNSPGLYRLFAPATADTVDVGSRWKKIIIVAVAAFIFGLGCALLWFCARELMDMRVVSAGDLKRATRVPVVARLPDTAGLSAAELAQWRFRAWSQLLRQLKLQAEPRVTLAFTSAQAGEGKSTLIRHLRDAAHDRRLPVVTVTNTASAANGIKAFALSEVLQSPDMVARNLREQPAVPLELVLDAGWKWNLENRARLQRALELWRQIPSLALLVELPAMENLDAVLAAELMPAVVWVAASGGLQQSELAEVLETVAAGEVTLAAAALNREPEQFARLAWLEKLLPLALAVLILNSAASAAETGSVPMNFSASSQIPAYADWQKRFTVGAGDIFNLRIYGRTDAVRAYVTVGPDGRISFMEAQSVLVAGLTVDEMRGKLDAELGKFYRNAHTVVTPVEWHSKKYYLLGAVMDRGAYPLDRPLTLIEAVARARGIGTGLYEHNTVELADMKRAFIVRHNQRLPVDFDALFNRGDLSQNILVEPDDYIYFPSGTVNEVYLLGAVVNPGPLGLTAENTIVGVLTVRGGLLPSAFRQRVLVVRGSLQNPQTFVVDMAAVLAGCEKDFVLQPKDIIYVPEKPWQPLENLVKVAVNSYVQAFTTAAVGNHIRPLTTQPLF